jgi:hypothetical protein
MSTKCPLRVPGKPKENHFTGTKSERLRACGKDQKVFLRVEYSELHPYHQGEGKHYDIFGFCQEHGGYLANGPKKWQDSKGQHRFRALRGTVSSVSVVPGVLDPVQLAHEEDRLRLMAFVKSDFKRKMFQENTRCLTPDDWRQLMEEVLQEWIVEGVMTS